MVRIKIILGDDDLQQRRVVVVVVVQPKPPRLEVNRRVVESREKMVLMLLAFYRDRQTADVLLWMRDDSGLLL
jgi:hypothetical protein